MVLEKWLDAGRVDKLIDDRTERIIREFERDGYHSRTTVDSRGHRQMRFSKCVPDLPASSLGRARQVDERQQRGEPLDRLL